MRVLIPVLFICSSLLFSACDNINSTTTGPVDIEVEAEPAEGGSVQSSGNQLRANPERGYIFEYWQINHTDGTISTLTDDSVTVNNKNIDHVTGVFGTTDLEIPIHLQAAKDGRYVYFVKEFIMPIDSSTKRTVSAFVKADIRTFKKQKIYITDKRIFFFDVSYDGAFIAFSSYNNDRYDTYVLNVDGQSINNYGIGVKPIFSNNSYDFLTLWDTGACIQSLFSNGCRTLDISDAGASIPSRYWPASWSPDDKRIAFSRSLDQFSLFDTQTTERQKVSTNSPKEYFKWLNKNTFLSSGESNTKKEVLKYSLGELNNPQTEPFSTDFALSVSPSNSRLVYINQGVNIFMENDNRSDNILNYFEWDPYFPQWIDEDNILFYDRNTAQPFILRLSGRVVQL